MSTLYSRPNHAQIEALVDFLEKNPGIAKGNLRTALGKDLVKKRWKDISNHINTLGRVKKDGRGWAKFWADKKCILKKKCSQQPGENELQEVPVFSDLEKRMIAVTGVTEGAAGDTTFSSDPFQSYPENNVDSKSPGSEPGSPQAFDGSSQCESDESYQEPRRSRRGKAKKMKRDKPATLDVERLTRMEEKRVNAELATAEAFRGLSQELARHASALESLVGAVLESGNAVANGIKTAGQTIATAILNIENKFDSI